ncbi:MAG: sensor histidine kinase, partial [Bdellovibrionales bacterium]
ADGFTLGFLAVMDRQPHNLTPDQVQSLKVLADQAVQLMELRKANVRVLESARILSKYTQIIEDQQETLIQTAKMSSLGSMAAGIAHEINTPLAAIKSRAEVMLEELEMGGSDPIDLPGSLTKIIQMVDRVASIITGLRMFSRNSTTDPKASCKIQDLVKDTIELCGDRLKSRGIELRLAIEEGIEVDCRAAEISQVLLNLISNASDAVENRTEKWVQIEVKRHPDSVQISVTDSGPGIDPKITEKLMDPFFTTKEVGKGTGLGLSISKGLVEAHGGRFYLDKNFSRTRFIIELPAIPSHTEIKKEAA